MIWELGTCVIPYSRTRKSAWVSLPAPGVPTKMTMFTGTPSMRPRYGTHPKRKANVLHTPVETALTSRSALLAFPELPQKEVSVKRTILPIALLCETPALAQQPAAPDTAWFNEP